MPYARTTDPCENCKGFAKLRGNRFCLMCMVNGVRRKILFSFKIDRPNDIEIFEAEMIRRKVLDHNERNYL